MSSLTERGDRFTASVGGTHRVSQINALWTHLFFFVKYPDALWSFFKELLLFIAWIIFGCGYSCPRRLVFNFPLPKPTDILSNVVISQSAEVQHHCDRARFSSTVQGKVSHQPTERPVPEGAGGSRGSPHRSMCQRADSVPSYRDLTGTVGDRIRTTLSSGGSTFCRDSTMSKSFGRSDRKVACCEKCSATLVALKKQALSLAVHHHFSCKVSNRKALMQPVNVVEHRAPYQAAGLWSQRQRETAECGFGSNIVDVRQMIKYARFLSGCTLYEILFSTFAN